MILVPGGVPGSAAFDTTVTALDAAMADVELRPAGSVDVALLILPALVPELSRGPDGASAFVQLVTRARERMQARHAGDDAPFYCVAFHPDFVEDLKDEHRAVRFIRRSPDPTVQLVRASVLRSVRGGGASDYVDTTGLTPAELLAVTAPLSVSDRIGRANLRTLREAGPGKLRDILAEFHACGRETDA